MTHRDTSRSMNAGEMPTSGQNHSRGEYTINHGVMVMSAMTAAAMIAPFMDNRNAHTATKNGATYVTEYYLHLFLPEQPDLDWNNPEVQTAMLDVLRFWLDRGVDGFRIDVAHGMVKAPGLPSVGHSAQIGLLGKGELPYFDQDGVHEIYRDWHRVLQEYPGDRMLVVEAWVGPAERRAARAWTS